MEIIAKKGDILAAEADLLVVGMYEEEQFENEFLDKLDELLEGKLKKMAKAQSFNGKPGQSLLFPAPNTVRAQYILVAGLGKLGEQTRMQVREAAGMVIDVAKKLYLHTVAMEFFGEDDDNFDAQKSAQAIVEALLMSNYFFDAYKKNKHATTIKQITIIAEDGRDARWAQKGIELGQVIFEAIHLSRDLVNSPAKDTTPTKLAEQAQTIARESKGLIKAKIFDREECTKKKMGAFLAVAQGSNEEPKFIHLIYKPKSKTKKRFVIVGKGITFDAGGLSLKPAEAMETMKCDMAGAAAVLGVFNVLVKLQPKVEIHGIIAATENLPSGTAMKPGDIARVSNGKTIEILNTDAEGRLTLADALVYGGKLEPSYMIDLATLTGSCMVALGEEIGAVMTNEPKFGNMILSAAASAGEKMWEMPLEENYRDQIESDVADLRNIAKSRYGGTLTAGLFLQEFVPKNLAWAHFDIAGPAFAERPMSSYLKKGATGFGIRTILKMIELI